MDTASDLLQLLLLYELLQLLRVDMVDGVVFSLNDGSARVGHHQQLLLLLTFVLLDRSKGAKGAKGAKGETEKITGRRDEEGREKD